MAEAKEELVERVVVGPKPIHGKDKDGNRRIYQLGETMWLSPRQAKAQARYLQSPKVAAAQKLVAEEEAKAAIPEPVKDPIPGPSNDPEPELIPEAKAAPSPTAASKPNPVRTGGGS